jgi:predicted HicB family RNase H-like nuclease
MATYSLLFGHAEWPADAGADASEPARPRYPERITLRLPAALRRRIESSAARDGLAADEWVSVVLARALDGAPTQTAR